MKFSIGQIAALLDGAIEGDDKLDIITVKPIENATPGSITFLSNPKYEPHLYSTRASAVILDRSFELTKKSPATLIRVDDAYASFTALLEEFEKLLSFRKTGIEQPAFQSPSATYGEGVYLGAFSYLGDGVRLGKNVKIYPNAYIGDNAIIGDNTIIYSGVRIYAGCEIGRYCILHAGAVLGSDGFGFAPQEDGSYKKIPQLGKVILEDHVEIGANTVVDCATFESTLIRRGVKLDNLIQVAHNAEIGENTVIAAQAGISGSTKVGKNCVIGGQAGLVGHLKIADHTKIQAQSGVTKNTREGQAIFGYPAIDYNNYLKSYAVFRKLPEVLKKVEELEEKILNLASPNHE